MCATDYNLIPAEQFTHGPPHGPLVSAGHGRHAATVATDRFENACPGSQVHALSSPQPMHDSPEFAGHGTHADTLFDPTVVEYVRVLTRSTRPSPR